DILAPLARHMDKFVVINNLHGFGNNHPQNAASLFTGDSAVVSSGDFFTKVKQTNPFIEFSSMLTSQTSSDIGYVVLHQNTKEPFGYKRLFAKPFGGQKYDDPESVYSAYDEKTGKFSDPFPGGIQVSQDRFDARMRLLEIMNQSGQHLTGKSVDRHERAFKKAESILGGKFNKLFDIGDESTETLEKYGDTQVGKQFLIAKKLLEHGARIVCANDGNYDNHEALYGNMRIMIPRFARALSAFLDDIQKMDDKVYVVIVSEFGRSPKMNHIGGREHWSSAFGMLVAGDDIGGGRVIGKTNNDGEIVGDAFHSSLVGETVLDLMKLARFETRGEVVTDKRFPYIDIFKERVVG
ncbi:MAG: DUF1501 domain-containing protein, partial [Candidatus Melainabacteria bacterium]|nr:DUF1501 domain-containing protein [Candidatus Melainabacteria bacterium]